MPAKYSDEQRTNAFWAKIDVRGENECWNWKGYKNKDGYGRFYDGEKYKKSHVLALRYSKGITPTKEKPYVLHSCGNRSCCNPSHLRIGTAKENTRDCINDGNHISIKENIKKRKFKGSFWSQKLMPHDVMLIHILKKENPKLKQWQIAEIFDLSRMQISYILNGKSWPEVKKEFDEITSNRENSNCLK